MSDTFKALVFEEEDGKVSNQIKDLSVDDLPKGDVLVRVEYSDVNYKDGMIVNGIGGLVRNYPHVPGIDFSGIVEESSHARFNTGDKVVLLDGGLVKSMGRLRPTSAREWRLAGGSSGRTFYAPGNGRRHGGFDLDALCYGA